MDYLMCKKNNYKIYVTSIYSILIYVFVCMFGCHTPQQKNKSTLKFSAALDSIINSSKSINPIIDSLITNVKQADTDTLQIDALNELPQKFYSINSSKSKLIALETYRLSDSLNYENGKLTAKARLGFYYAIVGKMDTSMYLLKLSLSEAKRINRLKLQTYCNSVLGNMYIRFSEIDSCRFYANRGLELANQTNDFKFIAYNNSVKAEIYSYLNQIDSSAYYKQKNIIYSEKHNDYGQLCSDYRYLGDLYQTTKNQSKAIECLQKAIFYSKKDYDDRFLGSSYITLGVLYQTLKEYKKAIALYQLGLKYAKKTNDKYLEYTGYFGLASLYHINNSKNSFFYYFNKALPLAKQMKKGNHLGELYLSAAEISLNNNKIETAQHYLDSSLIYVNGKNTSDIKSEYYYILGKILLKKGEISKANDFLLKGFNYTLIDNDYGDMIEIGKQLSENYQKQGDFANALKYYTIYKNAEDSLTNESNIKKFAAAEYNLKEQDLKLKQEKKENELTLLNQKTIQQKNYWIYGSIAGSIILIILLITTYLYFKRNQLKQEKIKLVNEQKRLLLEQKFLRLQMNPHFIYNSLDSIQSFVLNNQAQLASDYLTRFAKLMRMILEHSREEYITIDEEIHALEHYLLLQELVYEHKFTYTISIDESIDTENTVIPPLLLQPVVENAIKHGIKNVSRKGLIEITIKQINDSICIDITDNGVGLHQKKQINHDQQNTHQSLSTIITKERLELINKNKVQQISISLNELKNDLNEVIGTVVRFKIPLKLAQ